VVSCRCRDYAAGEDIGGEVDHLVVRAANLEREHGLVVFALEVDRVVQSRGQVAGGFEFAFASDVVDARGQDFLQVIRVCHSGAVRARLCAPFLSESVNNSPRGWRWRLDGVELTRWVDARLLLSRVSRALPSLVLHF
jgi:hypothetical protein